MFKLASSLVLSVLSATTSLPAASAHLAPSHPTAIIPSPFYGKRSKSEQKQPPCDPNLPGCPNRNQPEDQCAPGIPGCPHTYRCADPAVCPRPSTPIGERAADWTWGDTQIPYLLSPRFTFVLPSQPLLLRWQAVTNATHYQVTVLDGANEVWSGTTDATQLQYAGPALTAEVEYRVEIIAYGANNEVSLADSYADPNQPVWMVLSLEQAALILNQVKAVRQSDLDVHEQTRQIAQIYLDNNLMVDGREQLEQLWAHQPSPELALRLGGLYFYEFRLSQEARVYYQAVLEPGRNATPEQRAIALTALGYVQSTLLDYEGALEHWQDALELHQQLGNAEAIATVNDAMVNVEQILRMLERENEP